MCQLLVFTYIVYWKSVALYQSLQMDKEQTSIKIYVTYFRYVSRYIFVSSKCLTTVSRIPRNRYIVSGEERHLVLWEQAFERE